GGRRGRKRPRDDKDVLRRNRSEPQRATAEGAPHGATDAVLLLRAAARLTTGLVMRERSERIGRWSGAVRAAGLFGNALAERPQASFRPGPPLNPEQRGAHERSEWAAAKGCG